ncbi:hypothetical protein BBJ28_00011261 [Nothophytophthora sp. Chile5]|nr:hypothetical protein BBJ28_00011261 [Nothophytophthora sp. Chile5]
MLYDYEGFPPEAYKVVYGAKGDSEFANEVSSLLSRSKIKTTQTLRGFDHGAFVPMTLIRRQADIPVVTLSINWKLNPRAHFELGRALAPLRDQDTLIICSGQATHGQRGEGGEVPQSALDFQDWLDETVMTGESELTPKRLLAMVFSQRLVLLCAVAAAVLLSDAGVADAEVVPSRDVNGVDPSLFRELSEEVVKVHVKVHPTEAKPEEDKHAPKKHAPKKHAKKHAKEHAKDPVKEHAKEPKHKHHSTKAVDETTDNNEIVRKYAHGSVRIEAKGSKTKNHAKHHHHKKDVAEGEATTNAETVTNYDHGSVKISGKNSGEPANEREQEGKGHGEKANVPDEAEVTTTANEVNELVTKLSSTSASNNKSFIDGYAPIVIICGVIGGLAAIVGVAAIVLTQDRQSSENLDSVLDASADLDVDVEANITSAGVEGEDAAADGKDRLDDSESDVDDEEEGSFSNGTAHVSV